MKGRVMAKTLLIMGAGGHGKAVADAALLSGEWQNVIFVDDRWPSITAMAGHPVVAASDGLAAVAMQAQGGIAAVGNNTVREHWVCSLEAAGVPLVSVIHPAATVATSAHVGAGSTIMAQAVVGVDAVLGKACIVNAGAIADHDVVLDDFAHLGVGVALSGGVRVGHHAWLQAGCCAGYGVMVEALSVHRSGTVLSLPAAEA